MSCQPEKGNELSQSGNATGSRGISIPLVEVHLEFFVYAAKLCIWSFQNEEDESTMPISDHSTDM